MKRILLPFMVFLLISFTASFAQGLMDYVKEVKGDVLVIKDFTDMDFQPNSLNNAVTADSVDVPAGRVYELQSGGWYPQSAGFTTPSNRPVVIAGADDTRLVVNDGSTQIPILSGYSDESGNYVGGITAGDDFTIKNISLIVGSPDGTGGWAFFGAGVSNKKMVFENMMMEHNWWVFTQSNGREGNSYYFKDNYFVNMSGRACWRNGGVYDNVDFSTDTMYVENNTHVMAQGMMYKFRNYNVKWIFINHNTFINCTGTFFETKGYQSNVIITNNIFVNSNIHAHHSPYVFAEDVSETDADGMPTGLINVAELPATMDQLDRKWLVEDNVAYWDPRVADMAGTANSASVNGWTNWVNQSVKMNGRTQGYFDDDANYPYLTEGTWYDKLPSFTDSKDLLTDQVDVIKAFSLSIVDTTSTDVLPDWRVVNTAGTDDFIYSDWPIPVDLSYSDADLKTGGTDGLPVGDLNWFPAEKATFNANQSQYYSALVSAWDAGHTVTDVEELGGVPTEFNLSQNYPNPFNPSTTINFTMPKAGNVTLKVYNSVGQEVATLVNGYKTAQSYEVSFDASNLSSGVYLYTLETDNFVQSRKMILLK